MTKLILAVVASSIFGGAVGALATAATQSQASPAAIAAAVQRVQDQNADHTLGQIKAAITSSTKDLGELAADFGTLGPGLDGPVRAQFETMENQLFDICLNTESASATSVPVTCAVPDFKARR